MKGWAILLVFCCSVARSQISDFAGTDFHRADSIADRYAGFPLRNMQALVDTLTASVGSEAEKFRAIYKWVCANIEVDYDLVLESKRGRAKSGGQEGERWSRDFNRKVFATLREEHKTTCTGYAYLIRELAMHAGLECRILYGTARQSGVNQTVGQRVNHSWNEVRLRGKWYLCDATWSSGVFNLRENRFVKQYNDRYFLMEPEQFLKTHQRAFLQPFQTKLTFAGCVGSVTMNSDP